MTPFEAAVLQNYNTTTNNPAAAAIGDQGDAARQQAFALAHEKQISDLELQRELAVRGTPTFEQAKAEKERQEENIRLAKEADSSFQPDSSMPPEVNEAAAKTVIDKANLTSYKSLVKAKQANEAKIQEMIQKAGGIQPVDEKQVSAMLAKDPDLIPLLNNSQRQQLANGTITADQLASTFLRNKNKSLLLSKAQDYRGKLQDMARQAVLQSVGAEGQQLLAKSNELNDALTAVRAKIPAFSIASAYDQADATPGIPALDAKGRLPSLFPGGVTPATPAASTPAASNPPPVSDDPDNPYAAQATADGHRVLLQKAQSDLQSHQAEYDSISNILSKGGMTPASLGVGAPPPFVPMPAEQLAHLWDRKKKLEKTIKNDHQTVAELAVASTPGFINSSYPNTSLPMDNTPATIPPANLPSNVASIDFSQNPPQTNFVPPNAASPFAMRAKQTSYENAFGTSDPNVLHAAANMALQQGVTPAQLQQIHDAALSGDPQAQAQIKAVVARVTGANASSDITDQQAFAQ